MFKKIFGYIFVGFFLLLIFGPLITIYMEENEISLPNDYARIVDMDYKAIVVDEPDSEGKIVVTERMTFDVHAASRFNGFWELWRDLCEDYVDGVPVYYKVNSVKQILPDGSEIIWEKSPKLYWDDYDYVSENKELGPEKWFHSPGPYNEDLRDYECVFFYVDNLYREKIVFEIEYEMYNAVLRYNDCADLYIAMYSGDTIKYLESFKGEILVPNKDMPREGNYKITTYGTNANSFPVEESKDKNPGYHTFSFELTEDELKFRPHNNYIEFDLVSFGEDKHLFADYASKNRYYNDDALNEIWFEQDIYKNSYNFFKTIKSMIFMGCIVFSFIVIFVGFRKIIKWKKKCPINTDNVISTFRDIPNDLDPNFAATLVFCKDKNNKDDASIYSSILLSLARKKYIELQELSNDDVLIKIIEDDLIDYEGGFAQPIKMFDDDETYWMPEKIDLRETLTINEEHYLNLIKRHVTNNCISMTELQNRISFDYDYAKDFEKNIKKSVVDYGIGLGYFQKANYLEPRNNLLSFAKTCSTIGFVLLILVNWISYKTRLDLAFGGYTILGIVCIIVGKYLKLKSYKYVFLTEYGEQEYNKWRGLYNFLKSDTLINERSFVELPLWEKYLVYATAFGISEKVIEAIKIRCPESTSTTNSIVYNNYCRSGRIRTSGRHFRTSIHHGSHSYSSSGGSSGGYGGGGRGGGGGGGGH